MSNLIRRGLRLAIAYARWTKAGKPLRNDEYIFSLYDEHCAPCEWFNQTDADRGTCLLCDCHIKRVSASQDRFNKLAWPTEGCVDGRWTQDIDEPENT
jgi:hypothetical protein